MLASCIHSKAQLSFKYSEQAERTQLVNRRLGGLCHVSKPYHDADYICLQLVNPTAGLFAGDSLEMDFRLGTGAKVSLTSPSATRFHTMEEGESAEFLQRVDVGEEAVLDYWPEMVMAQRGSSVFQSTEIQLATNARMVLLDSFAPGRVAHGEVNAYREYSNSFDLKVGERLLARERMKLSPVDGEWQLLAPDWEQCYMAVVWCYDIETVQAQGQFEEAMRALSTGQSALIAYSNVGGGLAAVRILAESAITFRELTEKVRTVALRYIVRHPINHRKL